MKNDITYMTVCIMPLDNSDDSYRSTPSTDECSPVYRQVASAERMYSQYVVFRLQIEKW